MILSQVMKTSFIETELLTVELLISSHYHRIKSRIKTSFYRMIFTTFVGLFYLQIIYFERRYK